MNETPTSIGVSSLMEDLEQMRSFDEPPDSVLVTCDGSEVFLSFHWHTTHPVVAKIVAMGVSSWLSWFLEVNAYDVEQEIDGGLNG